MAVLRADLETRGREAQHLLLEVAGGVERVVADVDVVLDRECELAVRPEFAGDCVSPLLRRPNSPSDWLSHLKKGVYGNRRL